MYNKNSWKFQFSSLWGVQIASLAGTEIVQFALIWWLTEKTGSAIYLTLAALSAFIPDVFIGPFVGPLVDRWNKKTILFSAGGLTFLCSALLGLAFYFEKAASWMILCALFTRALAGIFRWPALQTAAAGIVPEEKLTRMNGFDFAIRGSSAIAGPLISALLIRVFPIYSVLFADMGLTLMALLPLWLVRIPDKVNVGRSARKKLSLAATWRNFAEGFAYVRKKPGLSRLLIYVSLTNLLLMPAFSLLPLYVTEHFRAGSGLYSALQIVSGVGTLIGAILLVLWGGFHSRIKTSILGDLFNAIGIFVIGICAKDQIILAIFAWGVAGIGEAFSMAPLHALIQCKTDPEMRGRVFSIVNSMINISIPIAMIISGPVAERLGIQFWYIFSGLACFAMSVGALFVPELFRFERAQPAVSQI